MRKASVNKQVRLCLRVWALIDAGESERADVAASKRDAHLATLSVAEMDEAERLIQIELWHERNW